MGARLGARQEGGATVLSVGVEGGTGEGVEGENACTGCKRLAGNSRREGHRRFYRRERLRLLLSYACLSVVAENRRGFQRGVAGLVHLSTGRKISRAPLASVRAQTMDTGSD